MQRIILEVTDELYDAIMSDLGASDMSKREATATLRDSYYAKYGLKPPVSAAERRAYEALERQLEKLQRERDELAARIAAKSHETESDTDPDDDSTGDDESQSVESSDTVTETKRTRSRRK